MNIVELQAGNSKASNEQTELDQVSLDALANFDFEDKSKTKTDYLEPIAPEPDPESEYTAVIHRKSFYKRPLVQLASGGVACLVAFSMIGQLFGGRSETVADAEKSNLIEAVESSEIEEKNTLAKTEAELSSTQLQQEIEQIEKAQKTSVKPKADAKKNLQAATVRPTAKPAVKPPQPPRPASSYRSQSRIPFPSRSNPSPPVQPPPHAYVQPLQRQPTQRVAQPPKPIRQTQTQPKPKTLFSLGSTASAEVSDSSSPTQELQPSELSRDLDAFMGGKAAKTLGIGTIVPGLTQTSAIAVPGTQFLIDLGGDLSGGKAIATVEAVTDKVITARAEILSYGGERYPVTGLLIKSKGGKDLKAKKNRNFFSTPFGKGLIGLASGVAEEATSRTERFTQFGNGGFSTSRSGGARDTESLIFGGVEGFTDPLLQVPNPENTAFIQPQTEVEVHFLQELEIYE